MLNSNTKNRSAEPEFPVQQELEEKLCDYYNRMLLAMSISVIKSADESLKENQDAKD